MIAKHIIVKGDVPGVFFRKYTQQKADALNLTGWVLNTNDGDVEIFVQGNEKEVEALIQWCWQGSPKSEVDNVEVKDAKPDNHIKVFSVNR